MAPSGDETSFKSFIDTTTTSWTVEEDHETAPRFYFAGTPWKASEKTKLAVEFVIYDVLREKPGGDFHSPSLS